MFDLARALFVIGAMIASARARYGTGVVVAIVCALLIALEVSLPFLYPARFDRIEIAFGVIFIGPTVLPHEPPFAASKVLMDPTHQFATALLAALAARRAFNLASNLPPDGEPSRRLDRAALRFVAVGVASGLLGVPGLLAHSLFD